jgi:hypothetical protein
MLSQWFDNAMVSKNRDARKNARCFRRILSSDAGVSAAANAADEPKKQKAARRRLSV